MAVTVNQRPAAYTPAYNPQIFEATSTAIGNADFYYKVVCTDLITGGTQTYNIKQRPTTGELVFNAEVFTKNYIQHIVPNNTYGWQPNTNGIRRIRVNIGEYFAGVSYTGTNYDYIIWNSVERALDWPSYNYNNYVYNGAGSNLKYLSSLSPSSASYKIGDGYTYSNTSLFLYVLSYGNGDMASLKIRTYDENGNTFGDSYISNGYSAGFVYTDKYVAIDCGYKGLTQINPFSVTGIYPIITASVAYYEIYDYSLVGSPAALTETLIRRIYIKCEPKYTVYTLHYLAKSGNFETLHFPKRSDKRESVEKKSFRPNPNTLVSNNYSYSANSKWERVLSSTGIETYTINTDWLTEAQVNAHREIITSPVVYMDLGSTTGLVPVRVNTSDILINKSFNNKLFAIELNIQPTVKNNYQGG